MSRWEPDSAARLRSTAMDLFDDRGYDRTTVADIAAESGLTARTFFRCFGDKREVLFAGSEDLLAAMVEALRAAPVGGSPMDAVAAALDASVDRLGGDRDWSRRRQRLIATHPDLQERELMKLASLASALARGLRERGVADPTATLAAEAGVAAFRVGFERWTAQTEERGLLEVMRETLAQLRTVAAG